MDAARALLDTLMGTDRDDGQATSAVSDDVQQSAGVVFTANRPSSENTPDPEAGDRPIDLSHKLSRLNGRIGGMSERTLNRELERFGCEVSGSRKVRVARLKRVVREKKAESPALADSIPERQALAQFRDNAEAVREHTCRFVCVIDFECTCQQDVSDFPHEIIEFPIVVVDREKKAIVAEFQSFCRPTLNPKLSDFCTELTGITQQQVDSAPTFREVLEEVDTFLLSLGLGSGGDLERFDVATDGPWDIENFLTLQCLFSGVTFPRYAREYVNLRRHCHSFYKIRGGVARMLHELGMEFEGREHSGIDDTRNIARIAVKMLEDGHMIQPNSTIEGLSTARLRHYKQAGIETARIAEFQVDEAAAAAAASRVTEAGAAAADQPRFVLFCDLDGVLVDFDKGVVKLTGKLPDDLPSSQMWRAISGCDAPRGFFGSLDWMADGQQLWREIEHCQPTVLTGCPMADHQKAAKQKRQWCARHLGPDVPVITCMSSDKRNHIVKGGSRAGQQPWTAPYSILIDDRKRNGKAWEGAGGLFVLHRSTAETLVALQDLDKRYSLGIFPDDKAS